MIRRTYLNNVLTDEMLKTLFGIKLDDASIGVDQSGVNYDEEGFYNVIFSYPHAANFIATLEVWEEKDPVYMADKDKLALRSEVAGSFSMKADLGLVLEDYDDMVSLYKAIIGKYGSLPADLKAQGTHFIEERFSGTSNYLISDLINDIYGVTVTFDNSVGRFTMIELKEYSVQLFDVTTETGDVYKFVVNNYTIVPPVTNKSYFRAANEHTASANSANVVKLDLTTPITGVPSTATPIPFDNFNDAHNDGVFTFVDNKLHIKYSGIYDMQANANAMKTGSGTTGGYLLGVGVNGAPVKGNWQQGQIHETASIDNCTIVNRFMGYLKAGDTVELYHFDNGVGGIDIVDNDYNYPMQVRCSLLTVDGSNPVPSSSVTKEVKKPTKRKKK